MSRLGGSEEPREYARLTNPDATITDPLGRIITLHDRTWFDHILKGHFDLSSDRLKAEAALSDPTEIQFSTSDADCRLYYGMASSTGRMVVVVADVAAGIVKTAYAAKKRKKGAIEWSATSTPSKA
jgi:hypothetical protein